MTIDDCYQLGYIIKPHGLKGELQILLDVDSPNEYQNLESVFVLQGQQLVPFFIEYINVRSDRAILAFDEITSLEQAEQLRGMELYLPLSNLPSPKPDEFFIHEIVGFKALDQQNQTIGLIQNAVESGPQLILVLENQDGVEILLPYIRQLLIRIDRANKELHLQIPEGLVEVYTQPSNED